MKDRNKTNIGILFHNLLQKMSPSMQIPAAMKPLFLLVKAVLKLLLMWLAYQGARFNFCGVVIVGKISLTFW